MNTDYFWQLIDKSLIGGKKSQVSKLSELLSQEDAATCLEFSVLFKELADALQQDYYDSKIYPTSEWERAATVAAGYLTYQHYLQHPETKDVKPIADENCRFVAFDLFNQKRTDGVSTLTEEDFWDIIEKTRPPFLTLNEDNTKPHLLALTKYLSELTVKDVEQFLLYHTEFCMKLQPCFAHLSDEVKFDPRSNNLTAYHQIHENTTILLGRQEYERILQVGEQPHYQELKNGDLLSALGRVYENVTGVQADLRI